MSYGPRTVEKMVAINVLWILKMAVLAPTALRAGRAYMIEQDEDKTDRRGVVEIVDRIGEPLQTL